MTQCRDGLRRKSLAPGGFGIACAFWALENQNWGEATLVLGVMTVELTGIVGCAMGDTVEYLLCFLAVRLDHQLCRAMFKVRL